MGKQRSDALLLKINGELKDLDTKYPEGAVVEKINSQREEAVEVCDHSCARLAAQAAKGMYPDVRYGMGPAIGKGFDYGFLAHSRGKKNSPGPKGMNAVTAWAKPGCRNSRKYLILLLPVMKNKPMEIFPCGFTKKETRENKPGEIHRKSKMDYRSRRV